MRKLLTLITLALAATALAASPATAQSNPENLPYSDGDPGHWGAVDLSANVTPTGSSTDFVRTITGYVGGQPVGSSTWDCDWLTVDYAFIGGPDEWYHFYITDADGESGANECDPYAGSLNTGLNPSGPQMYVCAYSPSGFQEGNDREFWLRDVGADNAPFGRLAGDVSGEDGDILDAEAIVYDDTITYEVGQTTIVGSQSGTIEFDETMTIYSVAPQSEGPCQFPELQS